MVCDAKEDALASYQKTAWDLHLQEYSSLNSWCVWGSLVTQPPKRVFKRAGPRDYVWGTIAA